LIISYHFCFWWKHWNVKLYRKQYTKIKDKKSLTTKKMAKYQDKRWIQCKYCMAAYCYFLVRRLRSIVNKSKNMLPDILTYYTDLQLEMPKLCQHLAFLNPKLFASFRSSSDGPGGLVLTVNDAYIRNSIALSKLNIFLLISYYPDNPLLSPRCIE
jgi:hypothetical protein